MVVALHTTLIDKLHRVISMSEIICNSKTWTKEELMENIERDEE